MKKMLVLLFVVLLTIIIYHCLKDNKILYVNIDDKNIEVNYSKEISNYLKEKNRFEKEINYRKQDYRITDFINDIEENITYDKNKTIKNMLIKADIITVWIANNDINYKINNENDAIIYQYLDNVLDDMNRFLDILRKYSKEQIIVLGAINDSSKVRFLTYYNQKLSDLCQKYKVDFIDVNTIFSDKKIVNSKFLSQEIIKIMKNK